MSGPETRTAAHVLPFALIALVIFAALLTATVMFRL
jgi:hypothetical protein